MQYRPDVAAPAGDTKNGYDDTNMLPSETMDATAMMKHWARYNMTQAQNAFNLRHAETIVTLSGAHTVGHSKAHKSSPTSLGTCAMCLYTATVACLHAHSLICTLAHAAHACSV
jgi:hypothetical protein